MKENTAERTEIQKKMDILQNRIRELEKVKLPPTPDYIEPIKLWYAAKVQLKALNEEWERLISQRRKLENQYAKKRHNLVKISSGAQTFKEWVVAELHHQHPTTLISVADVIKVIESNYEKWMRRDQ
jgi:DNA repair exonuclease SbcCD ATPase subunit